MPWWKLDRDFTLRRYYLGFAITVPPGLLLTFGVIKILLRIPTANLVLPWLLLSTLFVLGGAPLLCWAHKSSLRTGSPRPVVLAVNVMLLAGMTPFGYFLVRQNDFDLWAFLGASLVVLVPLLWFYCFPPKLLTDRIQANLKKIGDSGPAA